MISEKTTTFIVIATLTTVITLSGIVTYKMYKEQMKATTVTNTEREMIDNATKDMTEEEKIKIENNEEDKDTLIQSQMGESYLRYANAYKFGDTNLPEYPKEKSDTLYNNLIILAQMANYDAIITSIEEEKRQYKFYEDYNWKIGDVYLDATIMKATQGEDISDSQKGYMVGNLKDPNMLLIGTLMMPEKARRYAIPDKNSLTPIFQGAVKIGSTEVIKRADIENPDTIEDFTLRTLVKTSEDLVSIHKVGFSVEGHNLIAYLIETQSGAYNLYSIQQDTSIADDNFNYKTIAYYIELDNNNNQ